MNLQISYVEIDLRDQKTWQPVATRHPIFWPRDIAHEAWSAGPMVFERSFLGPHFGSVETFWNHVLGQEWAENHPHVDRSNLKNSIPIRVHGDAARAFKVQKLLILSGGRASSEEARGIAASSSLLSQKNY